MNKEKEIEELSATLGMRYQNLSRAATLDIASAIIEAGYRKSDEVRKETAKEILEYLRAVQEKDELKNCDLDWIAMQYGVEVDE